MAPATRGDLERRCLRVGERLAVLGLDGLLITHLPNVFYLTGLRASAAATIVEPARVTLITDARYLTAARMLADGDGSVSGLNVVQVEGSYDETIRDQLSRSHLARVGVEADSMSLNRWQWLNESLDGAVELVSTEEIVASERIVKDDGERACFRIAGRLLAGTVPTALALVRAGRTEREIAADIEREMVAVGFDDRAFETIVASGPNSASPHARPGQRRLDQGDLVVLDFGGIYDGYCVDLTRTVCIGTASGEATRLHAAVLAAQTTAIAMVRPGVPASEIDAAARRVLGQHGLAEAFGHSTGHGLGVEVHELPRIAPARQLSRGGADVRLQAGMVFTVEPGVYIPGSGGVRIEDDVLVTEDGCEVLTEEPRSLTVC